MGYEQAEDALYISIRVGGEALENERVVASIRELRRGLRDVGTTPGLDDLRIDLVFDVSGPILSPKYEGVRTGTFSPTERMLQIQVAVPERLSGDSVSRFLGQSLAEIAEVAKGYVKRRKLPLSTGALEDTLSTLMGRVRD